MGGRNGTSNGTAFESDGWSVRPPSESDVIEWCDATVEICGIPDVLGVGEGEVLPPMANTGR